MTSSETESGRWASAIDEPRSPRQDGHIERLIGSIQRECLDYVLVLGEAHLRQILRAYADYYNRVRTYLALKKDAPFRRLVQTTGSVVAILPLGAFITNTLGWINGRHN